jgi:2,3-diaminopropionate biosynthesis protein SbnA
VPVISTPYEYNEDDLYVDLRAVLDVPVLLKCEGFNFAGSIKLKAAVQMVTAAEEAGTLVPGSVIVESSSGNLGVALAIVAASKGYDFLCVTDVRCNLSTKRLMESLGARVHTIVKPDADDGFLGARMTYVRRLCELDSRYVWLNQYRNPENWRAHFTRTAPAIARRFPDLDVLFVGAGTTGTLMGCARYFKRFHPGVRIVAVDSIGSVTFGAPPARRMIPGLGTSVRPPMVDESFVDEVVYVPEPETVRMCHRLAARGFLFGGSTGSVVTGAERWFATNPGRADLTAVAIAPDLGERYLDSVYQRNWVADIYGPDVLADVSLGLGSPIGKGN